MPRLHEPRMNPRNGLHKHMDSLQAVAAECHEARLDRDAKYASRPPVCIVKCQATGKPMRAWSCAERQAHAHLVPAIAAGCEGCPRKKGE